MALLSLSYYALLAHPISFHFFKNGARRRRAIHPKIPQWAGLVSPGRADNSDAGKFVHRRNKTPRGALSGCREERILLKLVAKTGNLKAWAGWHLFLLDYVCCFCILFLRILFFADFYTVSMEFRCDRKCFSDFAWRGDKGLPNSCDIFLMGVLLSKPNTEKEFDEGSNGKLQFACCSMQVTFWMVDFIL